MNRRAFLKTTAAAALATFVLPTSRPRINLMDWCGQYGFKFDTRLPWVLGDQVFATNQQVCVKVPSAGGDRFDHDGKIPPFGSLEWDHETLRGWHELRPLPAMLADDSSCPVCHGTGYRPGVIPAECEPCGGTGTEWVGKWEVSDPITCRTCKGKGCFAPCAECLNCGGNAIGVFPSIVRVQGYLFDAQLYRKVQELGSDGVVMTWKSPKGEGPLMRFRFDGGTGLLVGLNSCAEKRLVN